MTGHDSASEPNSCCAAAIDRLIGVLRHTRAFIADLSDDQLYTAVHGAWQGGAIGGHVRHCWDHVAALVEGITTGVVDYDCRERGTAVERERSAALIQIDGLLARLEGLRDAALDRRLEVRAMLAPDEAAHAMPSTVGREVAFVLSHTIHHQAIMAITAAELGHAVPDGFGYAPSTTAYLKRSASDADPAGGSCAR